MRIEIGFTVDISRGNRPEHHGNTLTDSSWGRLRRIVKRRAHAICYYCGSKCTDGHVDHVIPLSRGGKDELSNLVWACPSCNLRKNDLTAEEFMVPEHQEITPEDLIKHLSGLPIATRLLSEIASAVFRGESSWSRSSLMDTGMSDVRARRLQEFLRDRGFISLAGSATGGYITTEAGYAALRQLVNETADDNISVEETSAPITDDAPEQQEAQDVDIPIMQLATKEYLSEGRVSTSLLQRRLAIGYSKAARVVEKLRAAGVIAQTDDGPQLNRDVAEEFIAER